MECNRDEATRAIEIAQRKVGAKDIEGAKKFALKAQQLYPCLEGLTQMMTMLDVLLAAEQKINGEMDWYGILQLDDVMAEDSVVKKQYRKLALLLHPDKNKTVGAEGAFKLIVEAWGVLSDKIRRAIYDEKIKGFEFKHPQLKNQQNPQNRPQNPRPQKPKKPPQKRPQRAPSKKKPPIHANANGFPNVNPSTSTANTSAATATTTNPTNTAAAVPGSTLPNPENKSKTFWTVCPYCAMQYEYLRIYENLNLLCRNCQKPFLAVEAFAIPVTVNGFNASCYPWLFAQMGYSNNHSGGFGMGMGGFANGPRMDGFPNANSTWGGAFPEANAAATDSATETLNLSSENGIDSEDTESDEMIGNSMKRDNGFDVPLKKAIGKEAKGKSPIWRKASSSNKSAVASSPPKVPSSSKISMPHKSSFSRNAGSPSKASSLSNKFPSSSKISMPHKSPFSTNVGSPSKASSLPTKPASSPKVPTPKASQSPKVPASPKVFERSKKRKLEECDQDSKQESIVKQNAKMSACSRKEMNNVEVGAGQSEAKKEHQKLSRGLSNATPPSTSKIGKSPGKPIPSNKQAPPSKHTPPLPKDTSAKAVRNLLAEKAKMEILKNLAVVKKNAENAAAAKAEGLAAAEKEEELRRKALEDEEKAKEHAKNEKKEASNKVKKPTIDKKKKPKKQEQAANNENIENTTIDSKSINVPDSDFHDFDKDRTENCFQANQIWSIYDDDNGMPRIYARIQKVVSLNPFKVEMNWIEPKLNKYQASGDFKVGKLSSNDMLNIFSHVMKCAKPSKGVIKILPRKSDVWALYREWDSAWDDYTPAAARHNYEMVEVLTDFTEKFGVRVAPLVKVDGYKNIFQRQQAGPQPVSGWVVPKTELLRFSHQIPARRLTTEEMQNIPDVCWELDPAATPVGLVFKGTTESEEKAAQDKEEVAHAGGTTADDELTIREIAHVEVKTEVIEENTSR